jgi:predicted PurR-regulated permease PerM
MTFPDRRTLNILMTTLLFAVAVVTMYIARTVVIVFAFAILFAYLIDPVVQFLQRHSLFFKNLRGPHVAEAYLAFLLLFAFVAHVFAPQLISFNSRLFVAGPALVEDLSTGKIATNIGNKYGWGDSQTQRLREFLQGHRDQTLRLVQSAERFTSNALAVLIVVPILAIFFLADGRHMTDAVIQAASSGGDRQGLTEIANELNVGLKRYVRAKVILGVCSFVFYSTAMLLLRFPHAIALGFLGGVLEFIPVAGWITSASAILFVGFVTHSHLIWMAALLGAWRVFMDYFISPRVVGENLEIHPLLVIFAVMVGGKIGGIVGIYLSIPLIVVIRVVVQNCMSPRPHLESEISTSPARLLMTPQSDK